MQNFEKGTTKLNKQQIEELMSYQPNLQKQTYEQIQLLTSNSLEIISRQPNINVIIVGQYGHGKSTLARNISKQIKFRSSRIYPKSKHPKFINAKIYQCTQCPQPQCYQSFPSQTDDNTQCQHCQTLLKLIRHICIIDCPLNEMALETCLTGSQILNAALIVVSTNQFCPQIQTLQHLIALTISQMKNFLIIQTKIDLKVQDESAIQQNYQEIQQFVKKTNAKEAVVIPISYDNNLDLILQQICQFPIPNKDIQLPPKMMIINSLNKNYPGTHFSNLLGGFIEGIIVQGILKVGDEIEIRPGIPFRQQNQIIWHPIITRIKNLFSKENNLLYAIPGGLINIELLIDPSITSKSYLQGQILGFPNQMPCQYIQLTIEFYLNNHFYELNIDNLVIGEILQFTFFRTKVLGTIIDVQNLNNIAIINLKRPLSIEINEKIAISRKKNYQFRVIGFGLVKEGQIFKQ